MRSATDVKISDNVFLSRQLYNSRAKSHYVNHVGPTIVKAVKILSRILDVPENVRIRICNIKAHATNGRYYGSLGVAEIKPRFDIRSMISTLAHEMVHAEQYHQGRLAWNGRVQIWNGEVNTNKGSTYARYRAQPWEVEAFGRQDELTNVVMSQLEI
jgi:hypothetical protein